MLRRSVVLAVLLVVGAAPVSAGGGGGCHGPVTDEAGVTVDMSQFCFSPTVIRVDAGETVTWVNKDSVDHNAFSTTMPGFGVHTLRGGESGSLTFHDNGVFTCAPITPG